MRPGYKQTEVGVIPEEWEISSLAEITDPHRPISYGIVQTGPSIPNGVRCLRVIDINEGRINKSELITTSRQISDAYRRTILKSGDLVMPLRGKVGDVGLVDEELEGANLTRGVALIAIKPALSPVFCQQVISFAATRRRLEQAMNGSALQEIPIASLRSFKIPAPKSVLEQRAIATALSDVDGLLGGLDRLIAKKRDLKQAAMQQLLTGQTRLPGFHGEWEVKTLVELGRCFAGGTPSTARPDYWGGEVFWLPSGRVQNNILGAPSESEITLTERGLAESAAKRIQPNSVLVAITGATCANIALLLFEAAANQSVVAIEPLDGADAKFIFYALLMERSQILSRQSGSAQGGVNLKGVKGIEIRCPLLEEQTAIASVLAEMDAELAALKRRREKTRALKQAMMQELLTGRTRLI